MPIVKEVPFSDAITYYVVISKAGMQGNYRRVGLIEGKRNYPPPRAIATNKGKGHAIVRVWEPIVPKQVDLAEEQALALIAHIKKLGFTSAWPLVHSGAAAKFGKKIALSKAQAAHYRRDHA